MADLVEVKVPDIGDFADVPIIEVLVSAGDEVALEDPLVTLESDKATMDIPAPQAGTVAEVKVVVGDAVSEGSLILLLAPSTADGAGPDGAAPSADAAQAEAPGAEAAVAEGTGAPAPAPDADVRVQVAVLGAGPGGYTAAFRAADLGLRVALIDRGETLGGVCLNVGCIPSKALLHVARVLAESEELSASGVSFARPEIDIDAMRGWKDGVVGRLTGGLAGLARQRKVEVIRGDGRLTGPNVITVQTADGETTVGFEHCIVAAGSSPSWLPDLPDDERVMDSTGALEIAAVPERLLVIGGGIIGLEMATVYDALGSRVTVVELMDQLIPGCDPDLVRPLHKRIAERYEAIHLGTRVEAVTAGEDGLTVSFAGEDQTFDRILVAVGRRPNGAGISADAAGVEVDERGFIAVDRQMRTNVGHIFAIGDVVGEPMLAHKATHEAKVAAEVIAGDDVEWDARSIPNVAYTDPEIAWTGLTETRARAEDIAYEKASFPWAASGRSLAQGRDDGLTKFLVEPDTRRLLGAGIVGPNAGELIAEAVHAIEVGSDAQDVGLTIHPHPTLSETLGFAAEMADGTITDLMPPRARRTSAQAAG
jgi:dihydrolipoamide dehydrogenase